MVSNRTGKIISLAYHEITADARVLKQARALHQAGYDVNVFCDWPEGMPQHDDIDGVQITRFRCYGSAGVTQAAFKELTFLDRSREEIARRYLPYAAACERVEESRPFLEAKFGLKVIDRAQSLYFKGAVGFERARRMAEYFYLNFRLLFLRVPVPSGATDPDSEPAAKSRRVDIRSYRLLRRKLFQAESAVYSVNFPDLDPEDTVLAVHAHDIYCLPAGVMLSRRLGVPLVYDAHEYEPARASKMDAGALNLPELIEDDCFPHVTRMITVSDGLGELYAKRYQGPAPTIIMNAPEVDVDSLKNGVPVRKGLRTVREQAGLDDDVPLIVFTGGIQGTHRGLDKVIEAMERLPNAHFVSLGNRYEKDDRWFMGLARKRNIQDRVTLLPPVDARDVPAVLSSATVSVVPIQDASLSYRYCLPNKLFEAAFAQIPMCVSDLPEMRRFVEALGVGKFMDQTNPEAIAAALQDVFDNRAAYLMTPEAESNLIEIYSWQTQATKLLNLYEEMIGTPNAPAR